MSRGSLWLIGIDYLEHSSSEGLGAIETLLPRIAVGNERQALKIIGVAKAKGLPDVGKFTLSCAAFVLQLQRFFFTEREICRVQAMKSLQNERLGNALEWAIRSHDSIFVTAIADKFLDVISSKLFRITSYIHKISVFLLALFEDGTYVVSRSVGQCWC